MNTHQTHDLAGILRIAPGQPRPHNLRSSRRDWASLLTKGLPADTLADRLASIYSLCGKSHRLCASMAVVAAGGVATSATLDIGIAAQVLQRETLREHVRRIALDWPRQLVAGHEKLTQEALTLLRSFPAFDPHASDLDDWLHKRVLGTPGKAWLVQWEKNPSVWLRTWSESTLLCVPQMLNMVRPLMDIEEFSTPYLHVHGSETDLRALAYELQQTPDFNRHPLWRGSCAETGTWTRLHQAQPERLATPWLRLGARLAELVRLAMPDEPDRCGAQWLAMGQLSTGPNAGLAWVEMARGLLIHHVLLDASRVTVLSCQVLAPTEWNFHPQGAAAQAIESLPSDIGPEVCRQISAIISAYDPCVDHEIASSPFNQPRELVHA